MRPWPLFLFSSQITENSHGRPAFHPRFHHQGSHGQSLLSRRLLDTHEIKLDTQREIAAVLPGRLVRVLEFGSNERYVPLQAEVIISFHELCLVLADDDWYMGHFNADGSADCWASYGSNIEEAIRGL